MTRKSHLNNAAASFRYLAGLNLQTGGEGSALGADISSAAALFGTHLNTLASRPFIDDDGQSKIIVMNAGTPEAFVTNAPALLQYQEWMDIDRTVIEISTLRLIGISDLLSRGLTHKLGSIGQTISLWDKSSDITGAEVDMDAATEGEEDTVAYISDKVPVPVIHKDFRLNLRRLEASRIFGEAVDTTMAALAGRVVAEKSEYMLFSGDPIVVDGSHIYGYLTHPDRNTVNLTTAWSSIATANNYLIIADVSAMIQSSRNDRHYGPWCLYVPAGYESKLDEDYRANDNRTVRDRIMALNGIVDVRVADFLTADNVVLVQLSKETVDLAIAQQIQTIQWAHLGGMVQRFKVMAIWVPRIKSDYDGRMGLVHLRAP